jgi:hypothetical protein
MDSSHVSRADSAGPDATDPPRSLGSVALAGQHPSKVMVTDDVHTFVGPLLGIPANLTRGLEVVRQGRELSAAAAACVTR